MTLGRLKWLSIVAPVMFLSTVWILLHTESVGLHHSEIQEGVLLLGITIFGAAFFAYSVFAMIDRLERRVVEQSRELEQRNQELATLHAVGRAASSSLELGEVLDQAMAAVLDAAPTRPRSGCVQRAVSWSSHGMAGTSRLRFDLCGACVPLGRPSESGRRVRRPGRRP